MQINLTFDSLEELNSFVNEYSAKRTIEKIVEEVSVKAEEIKTEEVKPVKVEAKEKPKAIKSPEYITVMEAAAKYHTSHQLIRYYVNAKSIPTKTHGRTSLIKLKELDRYMKKSNTGKVSCKSKPKEFTPFDEWKKKQFELMDAKGMEHGKTCSMIFSYLTKVYGIVWDMERKHYYAENGQLPPNTLRLCYWMQYEEQHEENEHYENLFENRLADILAA